jgi:hypothetical protein
MSDIRRPRRGSLLVAIGFSAVVAILVATSARPDAIQAKTSDLEGEMTGETLAEHLSLEKVAERPDSCNDFVEVGEPAGYCLDSLPDDAGERFRVGQLLRGMSVRDVEVEMFKVWTELNLQPSGSDRYQELLAEYVALRQQTLQ